MDWKKEKTWEEIYGKERAEKRRIEQSNLMKERHKKELQKEIYKKISNSLKGKFFTTEHKEKLSKWQIGKKHSEETKMKMKVTRRKNIEERGYVNSDKTKKRISNTLKGHYVSEITKNKIKEKRKIQITPSKDTTIEIKIQNFLKQLGITFFTHQYIKEIEHGYQYDILIPSMNLVIECDGDYWHKYPTGTDIDHIRTKELLEKGFKVLRMWEREIRVIGLEEFKIKILKIGGEKQFIV